MNFSDARQLQYISVEDYLAHEEAAEQKHEYVAGRLFMMSGGKFNHNLISSRIMGEVHSLLKNSSCVVLGSDNKVRIDCKEGSYFYYPDVTVVCGDNIRDAVYQDKPAIVVEVLSTSTRRNDEGEKCRNYLRLDSLQTYLMFEQLFAAVTVYQRTPNGFERTIYDDINDSIPLPEINASLPLLAIYTGVKFVKETEAEYEAMMQR